LSRDGIFLECPDASRAQDSCAVAQSRDEKRLLKTWNFPGIPVVQEISPGTYLAGFYTKLNSAH
jgi:hypothetical protein